MNYNNQDIQIIKCRDDKNPISLTKVSSASEEEISFKLSKENTTCFWIKKDDIVTPDKLRSRIEPWLTALFQSEHFSLLVGSGLTHAIYRMSTGD